MSLNSLEQVVGAVQAAAQPEVDIAAIRTELAGRTGLPEIEITDEIVQRFAQFDAQIQSRISLLQVQTAGTLQEKVQALHRIIEDQERTSGTLIDRAQVAASTAIDQAQTAATAAATAGTQRVANGFLSGIDTWFREKLGPIGEFFGDFSLGNIIKNFLISILPASLVTLFFGEQAQTDAPVVDPNIADPEQTDTPVVDTNIIDPNQTDAPVEGGDLIALETRRFAFYKSGAMLLLSLNGQNEQENTSTREILHGLENMPFSEILTLDVTQLSQEEKMRLLGGSIEAGEEARLISIVNSLQGETTRTLLRVGLTPTSLQNIIAPHDGVINESLYEYFGETEEAGRIRLEEILTMSQRSDFDWRQLTFSEISKLYISSIPALRIPAINALGETFSEVRGFFGDGVVTDTFPETMYIIPGHILENFARGMGTDITTNRYIHESNESVTTLVLGESGSPQDREVLTRVFMMKDYLLSDLPGNFLDNPRLRLSEEQKTLFRENLDYTSILSLYSIMGGISDIAAVNTISLPILLYAVSRVIGSGNGSESFQGALYLGNYIREALLSGEEDGLSKDEIDVLQIYGNKVLDIILLSHLDSVARTMGLASGISGLPLTELGVAGFAGGLVTNVVGRRMIARGIASGRISMSGSIFRRVGLIGMVAGAVVGGTGLIVEGSPNVAFSHDIEEAAASNDINRFLAVLERHRESIQEYTTPDGQRMVVSAYPGETPFVVFNNKVYILSIGDRNLLDAARDSAGRVLREGDFSSLGDLFARTVGLNPTGTIDGVNFQIQRYENGNMIFGEGSAQYTVPLNTLLQIQAQTPGVIGNDIAHILSEGAYTLPIIGSEGVPGYVLNTIGDTHVLFLREVGNIGNVVTS